MLSIARRNSRLLRQSKCLFSKEDAVEFNISNMDIAVLKQSVYIPKKELVFVDNKYLLYRNKQRLLTNWYLFSNLTIPFIYIAILIKKNPFYLTFPAALPLMIVAEVYLMRRFYLKQVRYRPIVQQIYLSECGTFVQVWYANSITRKLKNLPIKMAYPIQLFDRVHASNEDPVMHTQFPRSLNYDPPGPFEYAWMKTMKPDRHLMIPRRYDYADMQMLVKLYVTQVEVLKGKIVLTDKEDCALVQARLQLLK